jgi:hypothetical protein
MPDTFSLEELAAYDKGFKAPAVEAEPPPVVPEPPPVELVTDSPPVETGDVVVAADSTPALAADEPAPDAPPKGSARERIEELVAERNALKKYLEYRDSLEQRPATVATSAPTVAATTDAAPTLESCQFDTDKWTQQMTAWSQKQIQAGVKQALNSERQTATVEIQKAKFEERMAAFEKVTPDLKVVLGNPALPRLAPEAAALVVASDLGPQILHHLGKNPEKAARIARQSPIEQAAAIGRLEVELKATKAPQKQLSNAPSPPTPTRGAGSAPISTTDPKMSLAEFMKLEKQAMIDRRRRH